MEAAKSNKTLKNIVFLVLIFAFLGESLRFTESGTTEIYKWISIIPFCYIFIKYFNHFYKETLVVAMLSAYSLLVSLAFCGRVSFEEMLFVVYVFVLYCLVKYIYITEKEKFGDVFWKFLNVVTVLTLLICLLELIFDISFPNIKGNGPVNAYFANMNDLCETMSFLAIIYFFRFLFMKKRWEIIPVVLIAALDFVDDAKLSFIGMVVAIVFLGILYLVRKQKPKTRFWLFVAIVVAAVSLLWCCAPYVYFKGRSLQTMITEPLKKIFSFSPPKYGDSITYRTAAIIYGLIGLRSTGFLGLGLGNAPWYIEHFGLASSMHNISIQFLVEFGIVGIAIFVYIVVRVIKKYIKNDGDIYCVLRFSIIVPFIIISSQSSLGINDYLLWASVFYVIFAHGKGRGKKEVRKYARVGNNVCSAE